MAPNSTLAVTDCSPEVAAFRHDVLRGLAQAQKSLPSKWFYDHTGSRLFDAICRLPEYYPTRTELGIMERHAEEMARYLGPRVGLVEYGSGSSLKTRILLRHLDDPAAYFPLDISYEHLANSAAELAAEFPSLLVLPVCADYTRPFALPQVPCARLDAYFPGSTIGNFLPHEARSFLWNAAELVGPGGGMLIGVDLWKDAAILEPAYNDAAGVTAEFNLNLLHRINRELGGEFDLDNYEHRALWNPEASRIEMHLFARREHRVRVDGETFYFRPGESILTEYSHKYRPEAFAHLAAGAGWQVQRVWMDEARLFSVQYLRAC